MFCDEAGNRPFNVRSAEAPAVVNLWQRLCLNFEDATAFQGELLELLLRYDRKKGSHPYLVHLGSIPLKSRSPWRSLCP